MDIPQYILINSAVTNENDDIIVSIIDVLSNQIYELEVYEKSFAGHRRYLGVTSGTVFWPNLPVPWYSVGSV